MAASLLPGLRHYIRNLFQQRKLLKMLMGFASFAMPLFVMFIPEILTTTHADKVLRGPTHKGLGITVLAQPHFLPLPRKLLWTARPSGGWGEGT